MEDWRFEKTFPNNHSNKTGENVTSYSCTVSSFVVWMVVRAAFACSRALYSGVSVLLDVKGLMAPLRLCQKKRFLLVNGMRLGQMRVVCGILVVGITVNHKGEQSWIVCFEK